MFNQTTSAAKPINQARTYVYSLLIVCFALCISACNSASGSTSSTPTYESGTLVIMPLTVESIESGATTTATVSLSGSQGITSFNPVMVTVFSNESAIMSVSPESCSLYTSSNSCTITLTGESVGTATFSVIANGYVESTSESLTIPLFSCVPDGANACGCLFENDGSGLLWYADASQTGAWTDWCTQSLDINSNCSSNGESIVAFNSGYGHCGHADWHLPTMAASPTLGEAVAAAGGNWGTLGTYAGSNTGDAFAIWLSSNGFTSVNTSGLYWSSVSANSYYAFVVPFLDASVLSDQYINKNGVLLVRP